MPPIWGWAPGPRHCSLPLPPHPLVPGIWSAKQISIGINKPLAPSIWSRGCLQPRPVSRGPEALASPRYCFGPEDEAPCHQNSGLQVTGNRQNQCRKAQSALACVPAWLGSHSLALWAEPGGGRGLGPTRGRERSGHEQVPASLLFSLTSRLRGGRRGELHGVKASGR